jgi:cobalt-precorrin 5A hydrolase
MKIAIVTINQPSLNSASNLLFYLKDYQVDIYGKKNLTHNLDRLIVYNRLDDILPSIWKEYDAIIAILAIGAVVRKIAPLLKDKSTDPAILVINLALNKIVPLLSGHLGGANSLATTLSLSLPNCTNFISTATDQTNTLAFEMLAKSRGWESVNLKALAKISNRLINGERVKVATYQNLFNTIPDKDNLELVGFKDLDLETVVISPIIKSNSLTFRPKLYLGIGCNRDTSMEIIEQSVDIFLRKYNLKIEDIQKIASFEAKKDEVGLLDFVKKRDIPIEFYSKKDINLLSNSFSKSASTQFFGLQGVAEPSSILASEYNELIIKKEVYFKSVTIAGSI